jgi:hypothetical protein
MDTVYSRNSKSTGYETGNRGTQILSSSPSHPVTQPNGEADVSSVGLSFWSLFTSYSHSISVVPAVRLESIFRPRSRQENTARDVGIYFPANAIFY